MHNELDKIDTIMAYPYRKEKSKDGKKKEKKKLCQPLERFELPTPGLQDQCSNH